MGEDDLGRWAEREARELIAGARAGALDEARGRLRARMVDALLRAADARLAGADPAPATSVTVVWLYGVAAGAPEPLPAGVDGHPVRLHRRGEVTALVSDVPHDAFGESALRARLEDVASLESLARAHERVLDAAMGSGAVVPFRLCTVYSSEAPLDAMLDERGPTLLDTLARLDGMEEWGVKAFARLAAAAAADAPAEESGSAYLSRKRERRDAAVASREAMEAAVAAIHARLAEQAAAAMLSRPQDRRLSGHDSEMLLNAAYLVPTNGIDAFRRVTGRLRHEHDADGLELELTGPWPPYHFVET